MKPNDGAMTTERVRVYCRLRPFVRQESTEPEDDGTFVTGATAESRRVSIKPISKTSVKLQDNELQSKEFAFDGCFPEESTQQVVYNTVAKDLVESVLTGYNATIMAYGQTGSGKTHTIMGKQSEEDLGILPRVLRDLFQASSQGVKFRVNYVQVYCERVLDLLGMSTSPSTLQIRESDERGVFVDGVTLAPVASVNECMALMERGNANRAVAATNMNAHSSRSHAIWTIHVERTVSNDGASEQIVSQLHVVDLAGSERVKKSLVRGTHATELRAINLSLSALGNCISALAKGQSHVPYRDSKLTRILQDSLGGNAKTVLVLTVSPDATDVNESIATLQFGQRARDVPVHAKVNVIPDYKRLVDILQPDEAKMLILPQAKLDSQSDRVNELDMELQAARQAQAHLVDKLEEAKLETSQALFELQAAKASKEISIQPGADEKSDDASAWEAQIAALVHAHKTELAQLKTRYDQQIETHKQVANRANQEWHNIEHELSAERTAHLATIQDVREAKEKLWALEQDTTTRISELCQETKDLETQITKQTQQIQSLQANNQALAAKIATLETNKSSMEASIESHFVSRAQVNEMETLYADAIAKLQNRVESLESSKSQRNLVAALLPIKKGPTPPSLGPPKPDALLPRKAVAKIGRVVPAGRR
ncbi:unnamed protein product [Aphanomyces euteiches]